jgi:hypothetical protein
MALRPIQARTRLTVGIETLLVARTTIVTALVIARTAIIATLVVARTTIIAALVVARTTIIATLAVTRTAVITALAVARAAIVAALAVTRAAIVTTLAIAEAVLRLRGRGDGGGIDGDRISGRLLSDRGDGGGDILRAGGDRLGGDDLACGLRRRRGWPRIAVQRLAIGTAATAATTTTTTTAATAVALLLRITWLPGLVGETLGAFLLITLVVSRRRDLTSDGGEIEDLGSGIDGSGCGSRDGSRHGITGRRSGHGDGSGWLGKGGGGFGAGRGSGGGSAGLDGGLQRLDQFIAAESATVGDLVLACKLTQVFDGQRGKLLVFVHVSPWLSKRGAATLRPRATRSAGHAHAAHGPGRKDAGSDGMGTLEQVADCATVR